MRWGGILRKAGAGRFLTLSVSSRCQGEALRDTASAPRGPSSAAGRLEVGGQEQGQGRETREWGRGGKAAPQGPSETSHPRLPQSQKGQGLNPSGIWIEMNILHLC